MPELSDKIRERRMQKELDGCYFGMPRMTFNIHWSQHFINSELYGEMPELSDKIRERRMQKELDGCYFGMPRMAFNIHWSQHVINSEL